MIRLPYICLISGLMSLGALTASAAIAEETPPAPGAWRHYPAFDHASQVTLHPNHVPKVLAGPRYVYYWAAEAPLQKNVDNAPFDKPHGTLWRIDTTLGDDQEVRHYTDIYDLAPRNVVLAAYNTRGGYLVAVNSDGSADVLWDHGAAVHCDALSDMILPSGREAHTIGFDLERGVAYVSTDCGVYALDPVTGRVTDFLRTNSKVQDFNRVAGYWILSDGKNLHEMKDSGHFPRSLSEFSPLVVDENSFPNDITGTKDASGAYTKAPWDIYEPGRIPLPFAILPVECVADGAFYLLSELRRNSNGTTSDPANATTNYYLWSVVRMPDGIWRTLRHTTIGIHNKGLAAYFANSADGLVHMTGDGYMFDGANYAFFMKTDGVEYDYAKKAWKVTPYRAVEYPAVPSGTINTGVIMNSEALHRNRVKSTYDGEHFWGYHPFRGFYGISYDPTANAWGAQTARMLPDAPTVFAGDDMEWNPSYGMLLRNSGIDLATIRVLESADGLCALRDGKWTNYSSNLLSPELTYFAHRTTVNVTYGNAAVTNPNGVAVDPLNPDHVYTWSRRYGLIRQDLSDPDALLNLSRPLVSSDAHDGDLRQFKSYVEAFPQEGWPTVVPLSRPAFDNDGTLWAAYWPWTRAAYSDYATRLYYWTAEDRLAVKTAADYAAHPMKYIDIDGWMSWDRTFAVPLKSDANSTVVATTPNKTNTIPPTVFLYDHRGTLDDTSDDILQTVELAKDYRGHILPTSKVTTIADTPDGRIWVGTPNGLYWFRRDDMTADGNPAAHLAELSSDDPNTLGITPFDEIYVTTFKLDPMGRIWVGTANGVYWLDETGERLLGHFTADNSGLGDNYVYGLGWNFDNNSVLISCGAGIYEYTPAEGMAEPMAEHLHAVPSRVMPGYAGYVTLTGVPSGAALHLADAEGNRLLSLPKAEAGTLQWRPADTGLPGGTYHVTDASGRVLETITILN